MDAKAIADDMNKKHRGFEATRFGIWGTAPVRPGDRLYVLLEARAEGDTLILRFDDRDAPEPRPVLEAAIDSPSGFKVTKRGLVIKQAGRVVFRGGALRRDGDDLVDGKKRFPLQGDPPAFEVA